MPTDPTFDRDNLARIEVMLRAHPISTSLFQGRLFDHTLQPLTEITIERFGGTAITLDAAAIGRLFMIPDEAIVTTLKVHAQDDAPAGLDIRSHSAYVLEGESNSVIVYDSQDGAALWMTGLHINRVMLSPQAPERFTTVAFGRMAIDAYRLGFRHINLFAAGHGPLDHADDDALIGYAIWPKFGFDAPVLPAELYRFPDARLKHASSVQDIIGAVPEWWEQHGSGRAMTFDLAPHSRSWSILLHYLHNTLWEDFP
jgi:hypothetical protein